MSPSDVGLVLDSSFEAHDTGPGHPERPERLARIRAVLEDSGAAARCRRLPLEQAPDEWLTAVHAPEYVRHVERACASGTTLLDSMDTAICPGSAGIARAAAGSLVGLCRGVIDGEFRRGFAAVRPPGHHAERALAMGFCLFNNVAVAARWLTTERGLDRVLIVDWDVHHGNGTQHIFEEDGDVFYFSVHQSPLYPGTGAADERGRGAGAGATLNRPLLPGAGDDEFLQALEQELGTAMADFRPEFVLISAGFDAHRQDPLAELQVSTAAFARATQALRALADEHAGGRLVSVLEGGYDLDALSVSAHTHLEGLLADSRTER